MAEITRELLENAAKELGSDIARAIREKGGSGMGFAFFVFDYGPSGNMGYASSANRAGVLAALKDFIRRQEAVGETSLHVDQRAAVARVLADCHIDGVSNETLGAIVRAATSTTAPAPVMSFEDFLRIAYTPAEREAQRVLLSSTTDGHVVDDKEWIPDAADGPMSRQRPYTGQPWTHSGDRGRTEIRGVTMRDLRDAFVRAVLQSAYDVVPALCAEARRGTAARLRPKDLFGFDLDKLDPIAIAQNLGMEVERLMGIFPNVPKMSPEERLKHIPMVDAEFAAEAIKETE